MSALLSGTPAFRQRFTAFANTPNPSPTAALSYDAASLLLRAYKAATPPKGGVQVAAALPKTRFTGARDAAHSGEPLVKGPGRLGKWCGGGKVVTLLYCSR